MNGGEPKGAPDASWRLAAREFIDLARAHPTENPALRSRIASGVRAATERGLPVAALFHAAAIVENEDGTTTLRYDFTTPEQLEDFTAVGNASLEVEKKRFVLEGECRFASGDVFADRIRVTTQVSAFHRETPNVNVALWTKDEDALTLTDGASTNWLKKLELPPGRPNDHFLFGLGYHTVVATALGSPVSQILLAESRRTVELPAAIVVAGASSQPLHHHAHDGLFATAAPRLGKTIETSVAWSPDGIEWTVNRRPLVKSWSELEREPGTAGRTGSVTWLTNRTQIAIDEIEITARLRPEWLAAQRAQIAAERAGSLASASR